MNSGVFEHPYFINPRDLSHRNHKYIYYVCCNFSVSTCRMFILISSVHCLILTCSLFFLKLYCILNARSDLFMYDYYGHCSWVYFDHCLCIFLFTLLCTWWLLCLTNSSLLLNIMIIVNTCLSLLVRFIMLKVFIVYFVNLYEVLWHLWQRNWVVVTNSDFLIPIFWQPSVLGLRYFKLRILSDQIIQVYNFKG